MVYIMLDAIIYKLKERLFNDINLELISYYYINKQSDKIKEINFDEFATQEVSYIAIQSFLGSCVDYSELIKIQKKLKNEFYKKGLNIFHFIGLHLQDKLFEEDSLFGKNIDSYFNNSSIRNKYLIAKVFSNYREGLVKNLKNRVDEMEDKYVLVLKHIYLKEAINKTSVIQLFKNEIDTLDMIDLLILEDLQNISQIYYSEEQERLISITIKIAAKLQEQFKTFNKSENEMNSMFRLLIEQSDFIAIDQHLGGKSLKGKNPGSLDIFIQSKSRDPLSILEALEIDSVKNQYITDHLLKLSENYNPIGLAVSFIVIYSKSKDFVSLWERYKSFVIAINYTCKLVNLECRDISSRYPDYAGIRIGLTEHLNRGKKVEIYHIFMDMNL